MQSMVEIEIESMEYSQVINEGRLKRPYLEEVPATNQHKSEGFKKDPILNTNRKFNPKLLDDSEDPTAGNYNLQNDLCRGVPDSDAESELSSCPDINFSSSNLRNEGTPTTTESLDDTSDSPLSQHFPPIQKYIQGGRQSCNDKPKKLKSIYTTCGQISPIPIGIIGKNLKNLCKVGEGVFGEVYMSNFGKCKQPRIFKIVAIEGKKLVNDQVQRKFEQIESEIVVSQHLNKLRRGYNGCYTEGYVNLYNARICQGKYPPKLLNAWNKFKKRPGGCENTKPVYSPKQLYAVFEYEFAGTDIFTFRFQTFQQSLAVIIQVAYSLAVAEAACEFEHRDLHWGNVLIKETKDLYKVYTIRDQTFRVPCCGLTTTIIDFTISRITASDGSNIFYDLSKDEEQFSGPDKFQFSVYKKMRQMTRNTWSKYKPKSNVLWIHYLASKFMAHVSYTNIASDAHYHFTKDIRKLRDGILKYKSCTDCAAKFLPDFAKRLDNYGANKL